MSSPAYCRRILREQADRSEAQAKAHTRLAYLIASDPELAALRPDEYDRQRALASEFGRDAVARREEAAALCV